MSEQVVSDLMRAHVYRMAQKGERIELNCGQLRNPRTVYDLMFSKIEGTERLIKSP